MAVRALGVQKRVLVPCIVSALLALLMAAPGAGGIRPGNDPDRSILGTRSSVPLIVRKADPTDTSVERAVTRLGGRITRALPIVEGFAATVPTDAVDDLARLATIRAIALDRPVRLLDHTGSTGPTPRSVYTKVLHTNDLWNAGYDGSGVTVAVVDTGITDVPDLAGRVLPVTDDLTGQTSPCVNFSGESTCADSYGHGTFMAGIVAGNGAASGGKWKGVAPNANLVSVKIAGRDGAADVSTVLAAIQWVVSYRDQYGIRVLNLSLGTDGAQTYRTDPLNYAVERAWDAGIVVVVAASNRGPDAGTISKPGDDPLVVTVGAIDDQGTVGTGDDTLPSFSGRGPTAADGLTKPDVVAPGARVVSLRAPGSEIDARFPTYIDGSYRKGSGTSMAAAAVSGTVALMIDADPGITPDRVKYALMSTTRPTAESDPNSVGAGLVDASAAALAAPAGLANQGIERSSGMGALDPSRGSVRVMADDPLLSTLVQGSLTLQLMLWDPIGYTTGDWSASQWHASQWHASQWHTATWYGSQWHGSQWHGSQWHGVLDESAWYGSQWHGSAWYGSWE